MRAVWILFLIVSSVTFVKADEIIEIQDIDGKTVKVSQEELRKKFENSILSKTAKYNRAYKNSDSTTSYQNPAILNHGSYYPLGARKGFDVPGLTYLPGESARKDTAQGYCKARGHERLVDWKAERVGKKTDALSLDPETGAIDSLISVDIHIKEIVCR